MKDTYKEQSNSVSVNTEVTGNIATGISPVSPTPLRQHISFRLGKLQLLILQDGFMYLDGGAMFHLIPKSLWQTKQQSDEENRIPIALNSLYLDLDGKKVLIDAGAGNKYSPKLQKIFKRTVNNSTVLVETLAKHGIDRQSIDIVLLSHLHRDHAGSLTWYNASKDIELVFPKARHIVHKSEWDFANNGNELSRVSYNTDDFIPVFDARLFDFFEEDELCLYDVLSMQKTGGHSLGHSIIVIESEGETLLFPSDIIPTRHHITLNWTCSYDYHPYAVVEQKRKIIELAIERDAFVYLAHETEYPLGKIGEDIVEQGNKHKKYYWKPVSFL